MDEPLVLKESIWLLLNTKLSLCRSPVSIASRSSSLNARTYANILPVYALGNWDSFSSDRGSEGGMNYPAASGRGILVELILSPQSGGVLDPLRNK